MPTEAVCRQWLSGTQIPAGAEARPRSDQRGNRDAVRPWQIHRAAQVQQGLKRVRDQINVEIVKRSDLGKFIVLPRRWIVERSIGWLNRCRRLAKDWECLNRNGLAFLHWASIRLMVRKLCQTTI